MNVSPLCGWVLWPQYGQTIAVVEDLLAVLHDLGYRPFAPDALYFKGQALLDQGRLNEAHTVLTEALVDAKGLGSRRVLWRILATLGQLEAQRGEAAAAASLYQQARKTIERIAGHISDLELRASFLYTPHGRSILDL